MSRDPDDIVKVYSGPLEVVEEHREALSDAGIDSRIVGTAINSTFAGMLPDSVELWVHRGDMEKAREAIIQSEKNEMKSEPEKHPHPANSPKPQQAESHKERYINPDPSGK